MQFLWNDACDLGQGRLTSKLSRRHHNGAGARGVNNIGGGKGAVLAPRKNRDRPTEMLGATLASFPAEL